MTLSPSNRDSRSGRCSSPGSAGALAALVADGGLINRNSICPRCAFSATGEDELGAHEHVRRDLDRARGLRLGHPAPSGVRISTRHWRHAPTGSRNRGIWMPMSSRMSRCPWARSPRCRRSSASRGRHGRPLQVAGCRHEDAFAVENSCEASRSYGQWPSSRWSRYSCRKNFTDEVIGEVAPSPRPQRPPGAGGRCRTPCRRRSRAARGSGRATWPRDRGCTCTGLVLVELRP